MEFHNRQFSNVFMIFVRLYALLEIELFVSQTPQRQQEISDHLQKLLMEVTLLLRIFLIEIKIMLTEKGIPHSSYKLLLTTCYLLQIAMWDGQDVPTMRGFLKTLIYMRSWKMEF